MSVHISVPIGSINDSYHIWNVNIGQMNDEEGYKILNLILCQLLMEYVVRCVGVGGCHD